MPGGKNGEKVGHFPVTGPSNHHATTGFLQFWQRYGRQYASENLVGKQCNNGCPLKETCLVWLLQPAFNQLWAKGKVPWNRVGTTG